MAQTIAHLAGTQTFRRQIASYIPNPQYSYKSMEVETTVYGTRKSTVRFIVYGRKNGTLFSYVEDTYNAAVDRYNGLALEE